MFKSLIAVAIVCLLAAPVLTQAEERQPVTIQVIAWYSTRDGYGWTHLINITIDGVRWTMKGDPGLDPGTYEAERTADRVWVTSYTLKGKREIHKYSMLSRSWVKPQGAY